MSDSYVNCLMHLIFSTKNWQPCLNEDIRAELYPLVSAIAKERNFRTLQIGGTTDHVHVLISLPPTIALADAVRPLKSISSKWLNEKKLKSFSWQRGYGAFSVSLSNKPKIIKYIANQEEHHRKMDSRTEFIAFLKQHNIPYDPKFI